MRDPGYDWNPPANVREIVPSQFSFVFFQRRVTWGEAIGVGAWVAMLQLLYAFFGGRQTATIGALGVIGIGLYLIGSFLNTFSEYQRHVFKRRAANKGKLYTAGLFHYAMHINYFGDVVLFTGWALLAQNEWLLILPLLMLLGFVLVNIPVLDRHLAEHYGDDFRAYAACTSKLVPFIY